MYESDPSRFVHLRRTGSVTAIQLFPILSTPSDSAESGSMFPFELSGNSSEMGSLTEKAENEPVMENQVRGKEDCSRRRMELHETRTCAQRKRH